MFSVVNNSSYAASAVHMRCPGCGAVGTFEAVGDHLDVLVEDEGGTRRYAGCRRCPNPTCNTLAFVARENSAVVESFPPERIDFDATDLPEPVLEALKEAVECHAQRCYIAAAIMVRKTLEEVCADRDVEGGGLPARLKALGGSVVMPKELLDGLDHLRLLGNDAAHIESKIFGQVGREEVEVALEVAKEVLKAIYQYASLIDRLRSLRDDTPDAIS